MKQFINSLLDESNNVSTQRFSLIICLFLTVIITAIILILCFLKADINYIKELSFLLFGILGIGIGGKVGSKFAERELNKE